MVIDKFDVVMTRLADITDRIDGYTFRTVVLLDRRSYGRCVAAEVAGRIPPRHMHSTDFGRPHREMTHAVYTRNKRKTQTVSHNDTAEAGGVAGGGGVLPCRLFGAPS